MEGQREFAKLTGGAVVPGSGAAGGDFSNDVHLPNGWQAEVKRFREGEKTLYDWIMDDRERPDLVAFRVDRKPWIVALYAARLNLLMQIQIAADMVMSYTEDGMVSPAFYDEFAQATAELQRLLAQATRKQMEDVGKEVAPDEE